MKEEFEELTVDIVVIDGPDIITASTCSAPDMLMELPA